MIIYLLIVFILLIFSAVFSGSETALFTISSEPEKYREFDLLSRNVKSPVYIFLNNPARLLSSILLANLLVNTAASSLFALFILKLSEKLSLSLKVTMSLGTIVITLLVIILGEITPKIIALRYPIRVITTTKNIIKFIFITLGSITFPLHKIGLQLIKKTLKIFHQPPFPTTEEIKTFIEVSVKHGTLSSEEEDFLTNLVELSKRRASEIMTPRIKMVCLDENLNVEETLNLIYSNRLPLISRIPVYRKTIDCITGVLYLKDLLTLSTRANYERKLSEIVRPAYFVPESKPLNELLEELRKSDSHIAIVIDEYGQTAGLITLEDILETLVGEIQDEYDREDTLPYKLVGSKSYLVSGDIDLKTLDQLFEGFSSLRDKTSADRLSGFILELWGRIPKRGEILSFGDYRFEIKDIRRKRINKILITKISEETSK